MKVVILAGGYGTRFAEETETKPKPMITIGNHPIIWHIMQQYSHYQYNDFVIALGYLGSVIKKYFLEYNVLQSNLTINLKTGETTTHFADKEDWNVTLVDTGLETYTGGRIQYLKSWLDDETFMLTYGDGVSKIDLDELLATHRKHNCVATVTVVRPPSRFGSVEFEDGIVHSFTEKSVEVDFWVNGGFMVMEPSIFDYIEGDTDDLAHDVLPRLAKANQLAVHVHDGFWQCMDNIRDKRHLEHLWSSGDAAWKMWD